MRLIDFTTNGWGHALHAGTWRKSHAETGDEMLLDEQQGTRRYQVMIHSSEWPKNGDHVRYNSEAGVAEAMIFKVEPCWNPRDMFTIHILRDDQP